MVLTTELPLVAKDELVSITDSQGHELSKLWQWRKEEHGLLHSVGL